jgi:hypothetical protein
LKREPLVEDRYQGEKAFDKTKDDNNDDYDIKLKSLLSSVSHSESKLRNKMSVIISLCCSHMFRQVCAILRELVCTFCVTYQVRFLVGKILKYKEIKFSVSSGYIIVAETCRNSKRIGAFVGYSLSQDKMHGTKIIKK